MTEDSSNKNSAIDLATELTIAWLANPNTRATKDEVPEFLKSMHDAVTSLSGEGGSSSPEAGAEDVPVHEPAVTVRKSLGSKDHIISLIDGKPYKTLTRHLSTHGLTPETYRARYGLKSDYPMVAPAYSEHRRKLAKAIGLGRKPGETRAKAAKPAAAKPAAAPKARAPRKAKAPASA